MKRGKKYVEAAKLVDRTQQYEVPEAVALVKKTAVAKFDETVEAHFRLGVDETPCRPAGTWRSCTATWYR